MAKVALIEKYPTNYDFSVHFPFEFDKYALTNEKIDKILKKDITLDVNRCKEDYDYIILVGKEPCKIVADIRSVTEYQGYLYEDKYIAMLNPIAVRLNPSQKGAFDKSINNIVEYIFGTKKSTNYISYGIEEEDEAELYLLNLLELVNNRQVTEIALDSETSALDPRNGYVLGISIAYEETTGVYISSFAMTDSNIQILQQIIDRVTILFFNMKFDKKMLGFHYNLKFRYYHDVMLEHYTLDENNGHGLKELCIQYTDLGNYDKELEDFKDQYCKDYKVLKSNFTYDLIPFEILSKYAGYDAIGTLLLHRKFCKPILENERLTNSYVELLLEGSDFLLDVEENGIPIDKDTVEEEINNITIKLNELTEELYTYDEVKQVEREKGVIFNTNSSAHLSYLLFTVLNLPVLKLTNTGNPSADAEVLDTYAEEYPVANIINEIKKLKKIKSTYLDKMALLTDNDGRFRTNFNLHTTTSGRLSSSGKMNAQQLPRKNKAPKNCMKARPGFKIVCQDLKTAEMYVAAVLSGDRNLQNVFITGVDYHGFMAVQKFKLKCTANEVAQYYPDLRQDAKTISFEILYKLNYNEPVLEGFPQLKKWLKNQEAFIKKNGYIYSHFGRKRRLADVFSPNKKDAQHHVRSGINFLVQSASSDINLLAGIEMNKWIKENNLQDKMLIWALVHDSILAEVADEYVEIYKKKLAEFTQRDRGLSIPGYPIGLDVKVGQSYGEAEDH